jgi:hypothetical protein
MRSPHGLEQEQQRPTVLGIKHVLFFREPPRAALKKLGSFALFHVQTARVAGVDPAPSLPHGIAALPCFFAEPAPVRGQAQLQ